MTLPEATRKAIKAARLTGDTDAGLAILKACLQDVGVQSDHDTLYWQGLLDLQDTDAAERFFNLRGHTSTRHAIAYAKFLWAVGDFVKAGQVMPFDAAFGPKARELARQIGAANRTLTPLGIRHLSDLPAYIFRSARHKISLQSESGTLLYTGQLGPGGAEKQFARMAINLKNSGAEIGPIRVAVKHTDPKRNGDFHLAQLKEHGTRPDVLDDMHEDHRVPQPFAELLKFLHPNLASSISKLYGILRLKKPSSVYLWQDGGVLVGALAAALAGVPRIVTSFRGLPPKDRPKLFRPEYEPLYRAIADDPSVSLTTNNAATADAYASWLGLGQNAVRVIRNAIPKPSPEPSPADWAKWRHIAAKTPECTKTLLGVFRCDPVKQPELWFRSVCRAAEQNPSLRAIHVGDIPEPDLIDRIVQASPAAPRIFFVGVSASVGFWMSQSDLMLHLAKQEGSPNSVVEAQLSSLPVIATPAGGTVEAIDNGHTGVLFPSTAPSLDDVVSAIFGVLADRKKASGLTAAAYRQAQHLHNPSKVLRDTLDVLRPKPYREATLP